MNKRGFSLVELMMMMLFVSLIVAAAAPMITKRVQELPTRRSHGMYICYRNSNNQLSQALYSSNAMVTNGETNLCTFEPPERASLFKIQVIGGGAGGYNYVNRTESSDTYTYEYDPAMSYNSLLSEFDNVTALLPTDSALRKLYDDRRITINVRVPNAGDSGSYTYVYHPPYKLVCALDTVTQYPWGFSEAGGLVGQLHPAEHGYTTYGGRRQYNLDPSDATEYYNHMDRYVNTVSSILERKEKMFADMQDPSSKYYSEDEFGKRKTFSLGNQTTYTNRTMNQLCYQYRLYSDMQLAYALSDEPVINFYKPDTQFANESTSYQFKLIDTVSKYYPGRVITGNTGTEYSFAFKYDIINPNPVGNALLSLVRGVTTDPINHSSAITGTTMHELGLTTDSEYGFLDENLFQGVDASTAVLKGAEGGIGGYLYYEYIIDTDSLGLNILQGLNTLVNRFKMGYCDTPGCTDNSFVDNGGTTLSDASDGENKHSNEEESYFPVEEETTYPSDGIRELINGKAPTKYAAIRTNYGSYVTITNNATGGTSPSMTAFEGDAFGTNYYRINDKHGVDGTSANGVTATNSEDSLRTRYFKDPAYPSWNTKVYDKLNIQHSLNSRTLEAGNGGAAGQMRQIQYNELPSNCTFTIGMGGEIVNTIGPSINQSALTQVNNLNNNNNRNTNFSCPNTEINITAEGGRYSLDTVSEPFSALSQLQIPRQSYEVEGDAGDESPLPINIFTDYAYPDGLEFGAGGNPAQITDTCVTIEGYTDYKYTTSNTYDQANREGFLSGGSGCYDDDDIDTLKNGGQVNTLQFREATKGTPGAVIITW